MSSEKIYVPTIVLIVLIVVIVVIVEWNGCPCCVFAELPAPF